MLGFVSQHRVHLHTQGVCRTGNSCRRDLIVGALRIACNGLCTAAKFHNDEDDPGCRLGCTEAQDCLRHHNACPVLFKHLNPFSPGVAETIGRTAIFTDLLFNIAVRGERLCILVARLLDAIVTVFNLQRTNHGILLNFRQLMYGRVKMMNDVCPTWAHTYQSMCWATIQTSWAWELPSAEAQKKEILYAAYVSRVCLDDGN